MTDLLGPGDAGAPRALPSTDATVVAELEFPVAGNTYFADCVANTAGTGTPMMSKWLNRFLQQVRRVITNAGIAQNNADDDMLWKAIKSMIFTEAVPVAPATIFYVAPGGNDTTGDGLTPGTAWATVPHAIAAISGYSSTAIVTINVAAGTYTVPAGGAAGAVGNTGIAGWRIVGAGAGSTIFDATATGARGFGSLGAPLYLNGLKVTAYYECFTAQNGGIMTIGDTAPVAMGGSAHLSGVAAYNGAVINVYGNMTITGSYSVNIFDAHPGTIEFGFQDVNVTYSPTITFSGVSVSGAVVGSSTGGLSDIRFGNVTFSGTPTGKKYAVATGGGIKGNGGGLALIPGTIAGTVDSSTYGWTQA